MPTTAGKLPIFLRVGEGEEAEIGTVNLIATTQPSETAGQVNMALSIDKAGFAALLREAADNIEAHL